MDSSSTDELAPASWTWHEALYAREAARLNRGLSFEEYRELLRRQAPGSGAEAPGLSVLQLIRTANPGEALFPPPGERAECSVPPPSGREALEMEAWALHKARLAGCRSSSSGCLLYGVNGPKEARSWAPCGCRDCPECGPYDAVTRKIKALKPKGLLTLTRRVEATTAAVELSWRVFWEEWDAMSHWVKRNGFHIGRYVAVLEAHQSGAPHLHVATEHFPDEFAVTRRKKRKRGWAEVRLVESITHTTYLRHGKPTKRSKTLKTRIKDGWASITGGSFQIEWEKLESDGSYIAKYLTKMGQLPEELRAFLWANRIRMWNSSRKLGKKPESAWTWYRGHKASVEATIRQEAHAALTSELNADVTNVDVSGQNV